jgi:hypothetical protein
VTNYDKLEKFPFRSTFTALDPCEHRANAISLIRSEKFSSFAFLIVVLESQRRK